MILLILWAMISDMISFIVILVWFFLMMVLVFTTFYVDINPAAYGSLFQSFVSLNNIFIGVYDYLGFGE